MLNFAGTNDENLITSNPKISDYKAPDVVNLRSFESQMLLKNAIKEDARIDVDVCYGARENGMATVLKEIFTEATVTGFRKKARVPLGIFDFEASAYSVLGDTPREEIKNKEDEN